MQALHHKLASLKLIAMDVDGVLTDGRITLSSAGDELRTFHVLDGLGIVLMHQLKIEVAWISGRTSMIVARRAEELNVRRVRQGVRDKGAELASLAAELKIDSENTGYIGDDWNDLTALRFAGVRIAVANAHADVLRIADIITTRCGGSGAVREIVDAIIEARGEHDQAMDAYTASLQNSAERPGTGQ